MTRGWVTTFGLIPLAVGALWLAPKLIPVTPTPEELVAVGAEVERQAPATPIAAEEPIEAPIEVPAARGPLTPEAVDGVRAPDQFDVRFTTTEGDFIVRVHREWAPLGVDRFHGLVKAGFYDGTSFFRVIEGFVAQWGIHPEPEIAEAWRLARIDDDPVVASNVAGSLVFATSGPNTRTTQLYLNLSDNVNLDKMGFAPFAEVTDGMDVVLRLHGDYGEGGPRGKGPDQGMIQKRGDAYLAEFEDLDRIVAARVIARL